MFKKEDKGKVRKKNRWNKQNTNSKIWSCYLFNYKLNISIITLNYSGLSISKEIRQHKNGSPNYMIPTKINHKTTLNEKIQIREKHMNKDIQANPR